MKVEKKLAGKANLDPRLNPLYARFLQREKLRRRRIKRMISANK